MELVAGGIRNEQSSRVGRGINEAVTSDDVPLAEILATQRFIRLADGPDEAHAYQLGKFKIAQYAKPGAGWNNISET